MKNILEVSTRHKDDDLNLIHLDLYFSDDQGKEGECIGVVCLDTGKVIFYDYLYANKKEVKEAIRRVLKENNITLYKNSKP